MTEENESRLFKQARITVAEFYGIPVESVTGMGILGDAPYSIRSAQFATLCNLFRAMKRENNIQGIAPWMVVQPE